MFLGVRRPHPKGGSQRAGNFLGPSLTSIQFDLRVTKFGMIRQMEDGHVSNGQARASEAGVCRGSDTPNCLCRGDIDMYIP